MRERLVVGKHKARLAREPVADVLRHLVELVLNVSVGRAAQEDNLPAVLNRAVHGVLDHVDPFLVRQPRHDAHERHRVVRGWHRHLKPLRELALGDRLAVFPRVGVVVLLEALVRHRVPNLDVDAVADAHEFLFVNPDRALVGNLAGVRRRHGGRERRALHRPADEVLPKVEVVDGEHGGAPRRQPRSPREDSRRRRPVVAVHHVHLGVRHLQPLQRALAEEVEPDVVVAPAVDAPDVEVAVLRLQESHRDVLDVAFPDVDLDAVARELIREVQAVDLLVVHAVVLGQDHLDVVTLLDDGAGERGDDVAHASNLRDGRHLHRDVDHAHDGVAAARGAGDVDVVIEAVLAVVVPLAVGLRVLEVKVHDVSVLRDKNLSRVRGFGVWSPRQHARIRRKHLRGSEPVRVRPPVPRALDEHVVGAQRALGVGTVQAVKDVHGFARDGNRRDGDDFGGGRVLGRPGREG